MSQVHIIDYGSGNLASVANAFERAGADPLIVSTPEQVLAAGRLVLPGVGAAGYAIAALRQRGLDQAMTEAVVRRGTPFLGICVGMQVMATQLFEFGTHQGLGWIEGDVVGLDRVAGASVRIPHMGWNEVAVCAAAPSFMPRPSQARHYYFCHSFAFRAADAAHVAATTDYGTQVTAMVAKDNYVGTQFHPERSQGPGQKLLDAFLEWTP